MVNGIDGRRMKNGTRALLGAAGLCACVATLALASGCSQRTQQRLFEERSSDKLTADGDRALERGDAEAAADRYDRAIDQHPGNFDARVKLARIYLDFGEPFEAREQLEIVRPERPNDPEVLELLGRDLAELGDADAINRRLRPVAQRTNAPQDWARLGRYLAVVGDVDGAEEALLRAARADGGQTIDYQLALADFYKGIGDEAQALRRYRMALFIDVSDETTRAAIREMGEVPGPTFALVPEEANG